MKFKSNQKVVCISQGKWMFTRRDMSFWDRMLKTFRHGWGPRFNEIVTVKEYATDTQYIILAEYQHIDKDGSRYSFNEESFEPIMSDNQLAKEIESIKQPFEA